MTSRVPVIGGNWKCNGTTEKVASMVAMLNSAGDFPVNSQVVVAPTALHLGTVLAGVRKDVNVSVQNLWSEASAGAWTGELTVDLIKDFGISWCILGHSERRALTGETPEIVAKKVKIAVENDMMVIACIGEQLADREAGKTMDVCKAQLGPILASLPAGGISKIVVAYEPVWAIGTGVTASPEQAQDTHKQLREYLSSVIGPADAAGVRIIYGGSVKGANCKELMVKEDIDGFLVGGASLKEEFKDIIASSSLKAKI